MGRTGLETVTAFGAASPVTVSALVPHWNTGFCNDTPRDCCTCSVSRWHRRRVGRVIDLVWLAPFTVSKRQPLPLTFEGGRRGGGHDGANWNGAPCGPCDGVHLGR